MRMSIKVFVAWVVIVTSTLISPSTQSCITQWFDHDDPSDVKGDSELLADLLNLYPEQICPNPIDIDVELVSGMPSNETFISISEMRYNSTIGFECINSYQRGVCDDYKVRFTCPEEWCSTCRTPWFDQGNPSRIGDSETLSSIMLTYPLQVCAQPIAIEVATTTGIPVLPDARFPVYDPTQGFTCVNPPLIGWWWRKWWCQDYKVRFTCPRSFSKPKCVTRWYDTDDPDTNGGDFEFLSTILNKYPGEICRNPIAIEAQTVSGDPVYQTENNIQLYISAFGFSCTHVKPGFCADYKVRFTCPDEWCSTCRTPWFDQDNPDKEGDWETLSSIMLTYPLQVCAQPIAIEVATTSGILVMPNGHFPIYDPAQGFACVNQPLLGWWCWSWWCKDYKVRFTCPRSFCQPKCVTRWFDFNDPTRRGDFELLTTLQYNYPGEICPNPIGIQAQTVSGQPAYQTGNYIKLSISAFGFSCIHVKPGFCADYKVRFTCPDEWCSKCRTPWLDRDNPSGVGDYETLSLLLTRYPLQVCPKPIAIEVTTISGTPALPPGNIFVVYDPLQGFECKNGACEDYMVRFTCPLSFCNSTCVTRWFDSDNPRTNGSDSELLSDLLSMYPGEICTNPIGIEAQTISGEAAYNTGDIFQVYNPVSGFACVNAGQTGGGVCDDYKVRFSCPETFCSTCRTPWFDRDDPDNPGDREMWKEIQTSPYVCTSQVTYLPIAIEVVTTISGSPALLTGNLFQEFDPHEGFECVNDQQGGGVCQDYKVRYTCPKRFCNIIINPKLTDEIADMPERN